MLHLTSLMQYAPIPSSPGKVLLDSTLGSVLVLAVDGKMHGGGGGVCFLFWLVGFSGQQIEGRHRGDAVTTVPVIPMPWSGCLEES